MFAPFKVNINVNKFLFSRDSEKLYSWHHKGSKTADQKYFYQKFSHNYNQQSQVSVKPTMSWKLILTKDLILFNL